MTLTPGSLNRSSDRAAALIIVLAFVVLFTGLVVAYFSRTSTDRQLAQSSFNDTDADLLARSALDIVVGDFRQEIVAGSINIAPDVTATPFYSPAPAANVLPMRSGNPSFSGVETNDPIPNLIRRSVHADPILSPPGIASRASAVNSTTDASANGRSISLARWNSHYLVPRKSPSDTTGDSTPINTCGGCISDTGFIAPDWVLVTRNGPSVQTAIGSGSTALNNPVSTNTNYVIGRYAYAVYDEGGLLDINVAGFPTPSTLPVAWVTDVGRKGVLAFADLTALPTTPGSFMSATEINRFVGFRNYATMGLHDTSGLNFSFSGPAGATSAANFVTYFLGPVGAQQGDRIGTPSQDFLTVATTLSSDGRTDQNFITRAELIALRSAGSAVANPNTLQYLGTFSREKNASTWRAGGTTTSKIEQTIGPPPGPGRFYMGDLNLIVPGATGLQQEFTLHWKAGTARQGHTPATPSYWSFKGPTNANALAHIPELTGPTGRFVGLVNYAMNRASADDYDYTHIGVSLSVVACLIDQYDNASAQDPNSGSTTTIIAYNGHDTDTGEGDLFVYGMENSDPNRPPWAPIPPPGYAQLDRPLRNAGEFGYPFKQASTRPDNTVDFSTAASLHPPILDLFTYNNASVRSGIVSLNTRQPPVLAAIIKAALPVESPTPAPGAPPVVGTTEAMNAANKIVNAAAAAPALSRADIVRLASQVTADPFGTGNDEVKETIPRALVECVQTRTWGLLIDLVAQTGHYSPNAQGLGDFIVEGEKRYWLHIAIDRFDGTVLGQQLEEVLE
jgi:hypothetical protein